MFGCCQNGTFIQLFADSVHRLDGFPPSEWIQMKIGFGSQIRSYTLHPQQRVKDHRTNTEMGNVDGVLEGDLDRFIRATLVHNAAEAQAQT